MIKYRNGEFPEITIEKNIPLPTRENVTGPKSPFAEVVSKMEIGDSFLLRTKNFSDSGCFMAAFRTKGWKGSARQVEKREDELWCFRIWRIS